MSGGSSGRMSPSFRRAEIPVYSSPEFSSGSSCVTTESGGAVQTSSSEAAAMAVAGCPRCLMYVMLAKAELRCPKCNSAVLRDFVKHGKRSS